MGFKLTVSGTIPLSHPEWPVKGICSPCLSRNLHAASFVLLGFRCLKDCSSLIARTMVVGNHVKVVANSELTRELGKCLALNNRKQDDHNEPSAPTKTSEVQDFHLVQH